MLKTVRRGKIWYIRGTVAGCRIYESTGLSDKRAAEIKRARREAEIVERSASGTAATLTFATGAAAYMDAGGEARYLGPILLHFGPRQRIVDIDNAAVNACASALYPNAAPATINRQVITPISAVVHFAAMDAPSLQRRFRRRPEPQGRIRWLTPEEFERLLAPAEPRLRAIVLFLVGTGCRVSEALALEVPELHLASSEAWIAKSKNQDPRMVTLPARSRRALAAAQLPEAGTVFRTPKGEAYRTGVTHGGQIQAAFNAARDEAGLSNDVTPHVLRHTWATWFYAATKDFGGLMDQGGWRKADMANRYRKLAPADLPRRLLKHGWDFGANYVQPSGGSAENLNKIKSVG